MTSLNRNVSLKKYLAFVSHFVQKLLLWRCRMIVKFFGSSFSFLKKTQSAEFTHLFITNINHRKLHQLRDVSLN